jgi:serine/threonine-protein kinase
VSRVRHLIHEIHRRSLWQILVIYLGVSWGILEAAALFRDEFGLPGWLLSAALGLLIAGLLAILVLAVVPDPAAPEDVPSETPMDGHRHLLTWRRAVATLVVALAVWGTAVTVWLILDGGGAATVREKSVAVLPFVNMSGDPENEFFSDGITETIITHLSKIADLRVISRTSVMRYKQTDKTLHEIADELGVASILEGSVQRAEDRVRITAQLIDAESDDHLWAEQFNRQLSDVFEIQTHVAQQITLALQATLTEEESQRIGVPATDNLEAYDAYLRGRAYAHREASLRRIEDAHLAVEMLGRAVQLDPDFAEAYAALSTSYGTLFSDYGEAGAGLRAKQAAERAVALAPDSPESQVAMGWYHYDIARDLATAESYFARARETSPGSAYVYSALGHVQLHLGKWDQALANHVRAVELDPVSLSLVDLGRTYYVMRKYADAEEYLNRSVVVRPDDHWAHFWKMMLYLSWDGSIERAQGALEAASDRADLLRFLLVSWDFDDRMVLRIFADHFSDGLARWTLQDPGDSAAYYLAKADAATRDTSTELARAYYDSARIVLEPRARAHPGNARSLSRLGITYAGLGQSEDALRITRHAVSVSDSLEDVLVSTAYSGPDLAEVSVIVGDYDAAIDELERLLSMPSIISAPLLRFDPLWNRLRDHPRFQELLGPPF